MTDGVRIVAVQATARELRPAIRAWPALRWWARLPILWLGACFLASAVVISLIPMPDAAVYWIGGLWLSALYGLVGAGMLAQGRVQAMMRRTPTGIASCDWRVDQAGLTISSPVAESRLAWEAVVSIREERDRIVFAVTPNTNFVLPRRTLAPEQARDLDVLIADVRASGRLGRGAA